MVNKTKPPADNPAAEPRFTPAESPEKYPSFSAWIKSATEVPGLSRSGLQARLAEFCGGDVGPQHVTKWRNGSIPEIAKLKKIAAWSQVDYEKLRALADKQREQKQAAPRATKTGKSARTKVKHKLRIV